MSKDTFIYVLCVHLVLFSLGLKNVSGDNPVIIGPSAVIEGLSVDLYCSYGEESGNFTWTKDNGPLPTDHITLSSTKSNLTISQAVYLVHSGSYTCIATHPNGTVAQSEPFNLTVQYLHGSPRICAVHQDNKPISQLTDSNYEYPTYRVRKGSDVKLTCCPSDGEPLPYITWIRFSSPPIMASYGDDNATLIMDNINSNQHGRYKCLTSNTVNSSESTFIEVLVKDCDPVTPSISGVSITSPLTCAKLNSTVLLHCQITPENICLDYELTWSFNGQDLTYGSKYVNDSDDNIIINNVSLDDVGTYKCSARNNRDGTRSSGLTELRDDCINSVTINPSIFNMNIGCPVMLKCNSNFTGIPAPNLSWLLPNSSVVLGSTIQLTNAQPSDNGSYHCIASSPMSETINTTSTIIVEPLPQILFDNKPKDAMLNHNMIFTCCLLSRIIGVPEFQWMNGTYHLTSRDNGVTISSTSSCSIMTITAITNYDVNRLYACVVSLPCSQTARSEITVSSNVTIALTNDIYLLTDIEDQHHPINTPLSIFCPATGGVGNLSVTWYRGMTLLPEASSDIQTTTNDLGFPMLRISSLKLSHEGAYSCVVNDQASGKSFNKTFQIFVEIPGEFEYSPPERVSYREGSRIHLKCIAVGRPSPTIQWLKGTNYLESNDRVNASTNGSLIISNLEMSDRGQYICFFTHSGNTERRTFNLDVSPRQSTPDDTNAIFGLDQNIFISIVIGAVGVIFVILIIVTICLLCCYIKCSRRRQVNYIPKAMLETTSFERRPSLRGSIRGSLRKDNSGILQQSPSNVSSLWTFTAESNKPQSIAMTTASSSVAISPGPPVPSPIPPPDGPTASLATDLHVPSNISTFSRQNLLLGGDIMGEGEFGPVLRGIARHITPGEDETLVAVKVLMPKDGEDHLWSSLVDFANQMKLSSPYVARILGICAEYEPFYVIYQYLDKGDLKRFLGNCRPSLNTQPNLTQNDLLHIVSQVAEGMLYLYTQQIIHGDLATRNCLVSYDLYVKIADLGIGHDLYEQDYYDNGTQLLPIRWMAPELLGNSDVGPAFSLSSDVWSFGVFCWEVFTYGRQPYEELMDEQVLEMVPSGHLLSPPEEGCPPPLYSLMMDCWQESPLNRPDFTEIAPGLHTIETD